MMIITTMTLGATMIVALAIGGLLTLYQLRQANDVVNSARAIFAADTGVELGLYRYFQGIEYANPVFIEDAQVTIACYNAIVDPGFTTPILCSNPLSTVIRTRGISGRSQRALQFNLQ